MAKKTAKLHITVVEFTCPNCNEFISNPNGGSHLFPTYESIPATLTCDCCGEVLKTPGKTKNLAKVAP